MNKGQLILLVGLLFSLSGCSALSLDLDHPSDAERAAEESKQVAALIKKLNSHPTGFWGQYAEADRVQAAYDLGHQFKAYEAIPDLTRALKDDDVDVRCNAAASLWQMADHASSAEDALRQVLNDSYSRVRLNAVRALLSMGVSKADLIPTLYDVTKSVNLDDGVEAVDMLISLGRDPKELVPVLLNAMAYNELSVSVITNLEDQKPNPAYLPILLIGATSANEDLRGRSVEMLGSPIYSSPEAVAAIRKATSDWSEGVRWSAGQALVAGGYSSTEAGSVAGSDTGAATESVGNLLKLLRDRSGMVRQKAAESLGRLKLGTPEVVAALREALKDSDNDVRSEAARALGTLGKAAQDAVPQLWTIWNDSRKIVRRSGFAGIRDDDYIDFGSAAGSAIREISGQRVSETVFGWYKSEWNMNPSKVRAALADLSLPLTEDNGPPTVIRIPNLNCGCGTDTQCDLSCSVSPTPGEVTFPVSVSFVFDPPDKLSKVILKSHVGDLSRCEAIGTILPGMEWTYSTTHTKVQSRTPETTTWEYGWTLRKSSVTYKTDISPSACEMELDLASAGQ